MTLECSAHGKPWEIWKDYYSENLLAWPYALWYIKSGASPPCEWFQKANMGWKQDKRIVMEE